MSFHTNIHISCSQRRLSFSGFGLVWKAKIRHQFSRPFQIAKTVKLLHNIVISVDYKLTMVDSRVLLEIGGTSLTYSRTMSGYAFIASSNGTCQLH